MGTDKARELGPAKTHKGGPSLLSEMAISRTLCVWDIAGKMNDDLVKLS